MKLIDFEKLERVVTIPFIEIQRMGKLHLFLGIEK